MLENVTPIASSRRVGVQSGDEDCRRVESFQEDAKPLASEEVVGTDADVCLLVLDVVVLIPERKEQNCALAFPLFTMSTVS